MCLFLSHSNIFCLRIDLNIQRLFNCLLNGPPKKALNLPRARGGQNILFRANLSQNIEFLFRM